LGVVSRSSIYAVRIASQKAATEEALVAPASQLMSLKSVITSGSKVFSPVALL
jgi:hypothetical protein